MKFPSQSVPGARAASLRGAQEPQCTNRVHEDSEHRTTAQAACEEFRRNEISFAGFLGCADSSDARSAGTAMCLDGT